MLMNRNLKAIVSPRVDDRRGLTLQYGHGGCFGPISRVMGPKVFFLYVVAHPEEWELVYKKGA